MLQLEDLASRIALAFGIGLLLGLERGWSSREARPGSRAAGLRTFAISGLLGGLVGALARGAGDVLSLGGGALLGFSFIAYAGVVATFGRDENRAAGKFSATTTVAAMLAFVLGAYAVIGDVRVAAGAAVVAVAVLAFREGLHGWVAKITRVEFESGLALLAMTFIALPIVPDRAVGPLGGVNLREVWILAIVLAMVSFAAYIAVKWLGERRGVLLAAAVGGVVSSTAVTLASARRAASGEGFPTLLAAGTALATAVSFVRVVAIAGALEPALLPWIAPALLVAAFVATASALLSSYVRDSRHTDQVAVPFRNPFSFWSVLGMAASIGVLILVGHVIHEQFGAIGAIAGAATMGLFDVDAMTVSMARLVHKQLGIREAALAILVGTTSNTLVKIAIAAVLGRGKFALAIAAMVLGCLVAGGLALWLTLSVT